MALPEKYRYLQETPKTTQKKRDAAQIRSEGKDFSKLLIITGVLVFVLVIAGMAYVMYIVAGTQEPM